MRVFIVFLCCAVLAGGFFVSGCSQQSGQEASGLSALVPAGERPVKLNKDVEFNFLEGPAYGPDGNVYFTDMWLNSDNPPANSKIWKMDPQQNFTVFMEPANVVNGLMFDAAGNLIGCQMYGHKVIQIAPDGSIARVIAENYNGSHIDGPNDIVIRRNGGMYISDPRYSPKDTWLQDTEAVYYITPDYASITRVIDDIDKPNGIVLSPDEKILFVNNTNGNLIYAYDVQEDGLLANKRTFATLNVPANAPADQKEMALADGMCIDTKGNIYCTTNLGLQVINSSGENLGTIELPELAANITFGDQDHKSLYIAGRTALYKLRVNVPGIIFPQK